MAALIRSASLTGFAEVARSLGIDPFEQLRTVGLDPQCLQQLDLKLPAEAVTRLLEGAAGAAGVEDFGLRMAELRRLSNLGPLALLVRDEPTLRSALHALQNYLSLHTEALRLILEEVDGVAVIREEQIDMGSSSARQAIELSLAVTFRVFKDLLGKDWRPLAVHLVRPAPQDATRYQRVFAAPLQFGSELDAIVCRSRDLDAALPSADPVTARYVHQYLDTLKVQSRKALADQVRQLIGVQLSTGRCSVEQVAGQLGRDRRTLHRQLFQQSTSYSELLEQVRSEQAMHHLENCERALGDIAGLLGFSALSAFSRWFQQRYGCSPSVWRRQNVDRLHG
jgi:AraC-like DNA-binding protein